MFTPGITLQFVLGAGTASSATAWFSQGHFSHVDAVLSDGSLLGARSDVCGGKPAGVQIRPPNYETWLKQTRFTIPCTLGQYGAWEAFLLKQVRLPYDKMAIFAFVTNRNWRESDAWICSELQAAALEKASVVRELYLAANKITPVMCAMVVSSILGCTHEELI
jgi:hypothetical protein